MNINRPKLSAFALSGTAVLALAACGSSGSSPAASSGSASSSTTVSNSGSTTVSGTSYSGKGFTTTLPTGWKDKTAATTSAYVPKGTVAADFGSPSGGDVEVDQVSQSDYPTPDSIITTLKSAYSASNVSSDQSFSLGGDSGSEFTFNSTVKGTQFKVELGTVGHNSSGYVIVLLDTPDTFAASQSGLQSILSSWKWTS